MKTIAIQPAAVLSNRGHRRPIAAIRHGDSPRYCRRRIAFGPAGALLLALSALWWLAALVARELAVPLTWAVPMPIAHSMLMAFGFMPLFFVGFLFTAGPRWLGCHRSTRQLVGAVAAYTVAWLLYPPAVHVSLYPLPPASRLPLAHGAGSAGVTPHGGRERRGGSRPCPRGYGSAW